jgi:glycosyltransferase involved in cell wall biosynthesis
MRVIPFKVMMALALGRPVITGHTPAIASLLTDGVECITVPVGDGPALGSALQSLADDPSHLALLASAAREAYEREFSLQRVGQLTLSVCHEVCGHTEDDRPVISSPPIENLEVLTGSIG